MREQSQALPPSSLPIILPTHAPLPPSLSFSPITQHNPTQPQHRSRRKACLSKQPLSRTEIYTSMETSVNSDREHSKSLADEEGDYAKASELYSRSLEIRREARFAAEKLKSVQSIGLMGGKSSREGQSAASRGTSSAWDDYINPQPPYPQESTSYDPPPQTAYPAYPPPQQYHPPPQTHGGRPQLPQRKLDRWNSRIADNYRSLEEVVHVERDLKEAVNR